MEKFGLHQDETLGNPESINNGPSVTILDRYLKYQNADILKVMILFNFDSCGIMIIS